MAYRRRITEYIMVHSSELEEHPGNWRDHQIFQSYALRNLLEGIGIAGALLVYSSPRQGGKYVLLNGHLRRNLAPQMWPVLVVDLTDEEADLLLLTHDVIPGMATFDIDQLNALVGEVVGSVPDGLRQALRAVMTQMGGAEAARETESPGSAGARLDKGQVRHRLRCPHCYALLLMSGKGAGRTLELAGEEDER